MAVCVSRNQPEQEISQTTTRKRCHVNYKKRSPPEGGRRAWPPRHGGPLLIATTLRRGGSTSSKLPSSWLRNHSGGPLRGQGRNLRIRCTSHAPPPLRVAGVKATALMQAKGSRVSGTRWTLDRAGPEAPPAPPRISLVRWLPGSLRLDGLISSEGGREAVQGLQEGFTVG